jgi:mono/diheme cytochrome c family protein
MLRRRVLAIGLFLPVLAAAVAACGGGGGGSSDASLSPAAKRGHQLAKSSGCTACHGADGQGGIGPAWIGALGATVKLKDGTTATVDDAYLTRSIKDPQAQVVAGYSVSMPSNNLNDQDVADLVAYITALKKAG